MKYFGDNFDIHTGGVDNIFPHHEGEIAQSEGVTGKQVVNHWVHGQHLLADGVKMAKSSGNAFIVNDLLERGIDPLSFRYLCMTARYSTRLNFTFSSLKAAENALNKLRRLYVLWARAFIEKDRNIQDENIWIKSFFEAVEDDLDMPAGLALVWKLAASETSSSSKYTVLRKIDEVMGLSLNDVDDMYEMSPEVSSMLENRSSMRLNGNFVQADRLRSKMKAEGYLVEDLESSSTVRLKNLSELREDKWPTISSLNSDRFFSALRKKYRAILSILVKGNYYFRQWE